MSAGTPYPIVVAGFLEAIKSAPPFDVLVTNLGVLAPPVEHNALHLEAVYGPMVALGNFNCICGISTIAGKAFFMLTVRHVLMSLQTSEQLIDQMRHRLDAAMQGV